jgi:glycosyltransferase involved in cell wall biosynthesis
MNSILITTPSLEGLGGVANYFKMVLPLLRKRGLFINHFEMGSLKGKENIFYPLTDQLFFHRYLKKNSDLVHINPSLNFKSFIREGLFILQAKKRGLPVIVFFHGWNKAFAQYISSYFSSVFRFIYGKVDAFIVLASEFEKSLRSWGITTPVYLQTTAIDPALIAGFNVERKVLSLIDDKPLSILFLARIERHKGVFEAVDAIKILADKGIQVKLSIAGEGPARQQLETYVHSLKLSPCMIDFLGYVRGPEKTAAFCEHDIFCFPSYSEGMPLALLEAIAFGMPVITCPVGGLVDIFQNGKMGAFVPAKNSAAIAKKIIAFASEREAMVEMARFNHKYAKKHLMAPKVSGNLLDIYRKTLETRADSR